jgi:hypothetical protein
MIKDVCTVVREAEDNYLNGTTKLGEHVEWSMHDTIERIDAYSNSKHTSGSTDSLGREKPFFNIVSAATNIWYRATDIDRKNIRVLPSKSSGVGMAFIATVKLQEWMRRERFGTFLNLWGRSLSKYGSTVVKFVPQGGRLVCSVIPWNRLIADPIQFDAVPTIEKFYLTPSQLRKNKSYDKDAVDKLIASVTARKTLDGFSKDQKADFIEIYEVHGELDTRLLDKEPDESVDDKDVKYTQQMHVVSFVQNSRGEYDDFCLYKGRESKHPYMLTHLIEEDGRTLGIGSVEYLFDSQWMVNHSVKNQKDTLDLASKLIFQTSDVNYLGRNVLTQIETGDIFVHKVNEPLTRLANDKPDITALQNFGAMWRNLAGELTSTPDALRGNTLPSGTPYSLGSYLGEQANNLFEQMTENKGLHLEDMLREYVIPHIKTKMNTKDEIVAILDAEQIAEIDSMYVPRQAVREYNKRAVEEIIAGGVPSPYDANAEQQNVQKSMASLGNKRVFKPDELDEKTWKEALADLEWDLIVEVTNETTDKQAVLTTLSTVLQSIASNPQILQDPNAKMILGAILTETGRISPIQLSTASATPTAPANLPAEALNTLSKAQ